MMRPRSPSGAPSPNGAPSRPNVISTPSSNVISTPSSNVISTERSERRDLSTPLEMTSGKIEMTDSIKNDSIIKSPQ